SKNVTRRNRREPERQAHQRRMALMTTRETGLFSMALTLALAGCAGSAPPAAQSEPNAAATQPAPQQPVAASSQEQAAKPAPTSQAKPDIPPPGSPLDRVMKAHFQDALLIRKAVIDGNPERAADPAKVFSEIGDLDQLPRGWQGFVWRMQDAARRITYSTSAAQAAAAAADLGVSCGMCHEEHGGPKVSSE